MKIATCIRSINTNTCTTKSIDLEIMKATHYVSQICDILTKVKSDIQYQYCHGVVEKKNYSFP